MYVPMLAAQMDVNVRMGPAGWEVFDGSSWLPAEHAYELIDGVSNVAGWQSVGGPPSFSGLMTSGVQTPAPNDTTTFLDRLVEGAAMLFAAQPLAAAAGLLGTASAAPAAAAEASAEMLAYELAGAAAAETSVAAAAAATSGELLGYELAGAAAAEGGGIGSAITNFMGEAMNFSSIIRDAGKAAVQGLVTNVASAVVDEWGNPAPVYPDYGPVQYAAGGGWTRSQPVALGAALGLPALRQLPALGRSLGGAVARGARGIVTAAGKRITRKNAVALAKKLGIEGAAVALGISAVELAQMVVDEQGKARRSSGISAADVRRTKRTIRKFNSLHKSITSACRPVVHSHSGKRVVITKKCR